MSRELRDEFVQLCIAVDQGRGEEDAEKIGAN